MPRLNPFTDRLEGGATIRRYGDPYDMFAVRFAASKQALHPDFSYSRLRRAGLQRL